MKKELLVFVALVAFLVGAQVPKNAVAFAMWLEGTEQLELKEGNTLHWLTSFGREPIDTVATLMRAIANGKEGDPITIDDYAITSDLNKLLVVARAAKMMCKEFPEVEEVFPGILC